jgi:ABC-type multidrug transport system ATPase subunit
MDVTIEKLTKTFGGRVHALREVDLEVGPGLFGLLGANGAGKTTLMRILAGIVRPTSGRVCIGPHDLGSGSGRTAAKSLLGYLPQELGVYPNLSAAEFLDYVALLKGMDDRRERRRQIEPLLDTVGLSEAADRKLKGFSRGMRQRVGIAQALLNSPRLLIVDEPTSGLDPEERIRFRNLLVSLAADRTVLLSTHIVEDIAQTASRLAVMARGRIIFVGTTARLVERAQGAAWSITTTGPAPVGDLSVLAALNLGDRVQYRVLADRRPTIDAVAVQPSLEDGYVALMREHSAARG